MEGSNYFNQFLKGLNITNLKNYLETMNLVVIITLLGLLTAFTSAYNIPSKETKILKQLHVIMRHGIRTPVDTYPNDPFINEKFDPNGWGQLTQKGISELYDFGKLLRKRYGDFLGEKYNSSEYYSQSTGVDRALASIMTVNAGLWQPKSAQKWSQELQWFPIPVHSQPLDEDMLLLVRKDCPQYNIELRRVEQSKEVQDMIASYKDLFKYLEEHSGKSIKDFYDVEDIYTTLLAEKSFGLSLPKWLDGYFPEKMLKPASMNYVLKAYNDKLQRLKGGVLLKKIISDWQSKMRGNDAYKAYLYGGHDSTISNLLSSLKIFDPQVPNYGMAILLELLYDEENNQYGIEIFTRNSTVKISQHQIPGCEKFCPVEEVIKLTENVIPQDWNEECSTDDPNYTTVKPSGP